MITKSTEYRYDELQFMKKDFVPRGIIYLKDCRNRILFAAFNFIQPLYRFLFKSDIAYLYCDHPVITPFIIALKTKLGISIHFLKPEDNFSKYRKVIVPNGMWPAVKAATDKIDPAKRIYCEVGFFPQNRNIYLDDKGVHGYSSIRNTRLSKLNAEQKAKLDEFRQFYTQRNFVKIRWDTIEDNSIATNDSSFEQMKPFIFVPLQLSSDTAFDLCPFDSNQEIINAIESALPSKRIIFKVHPWDNEANYTVASGNLLLDFSNRDLRKLIIHSEAVVNCNSTVMLEALLFAKKCASLGIGFSTNHNVSLECHLDVARLGTLDTWEPEQDMVDSFLYQLIEKQISTSFWESENEKNKTLRWLRTYEIA